MNLMLLDPRFWLGIVLWTAAVSFFGFQSGARMEKTAADARELASTNKALEAQAAANARTRAVQDHMERELTNTHDYYRKKEGHAKAETDRLIADIRANARRLSIPVVRQDCGARADQNETTAGRVGDEGRADIDPGTAESLVAITERGNTAIRKHAEVVDWYDTLRKACERELPIDHERK